MWIPPLSFGVMSSQLAHASADSRRPSGRSLLVAYALTASTPVLLWAVTEPLLAAVVAGVFVATLAVARVVARVVVSRAGGSLRFRTPWADVRIEV
jgi:hypothetical protein